MKKKVVQIIALVVMAAVALSLIAAFASQFAGCGTKKNHNGTEWVSAPSVSGKAPEESKKTMNNSIAEGFAESAEATSYVDILMDSGSHIVLELDASSAPITVANFQKLVAKKFYDGLIFHRIISGFMIQGGDPDGTGMGGSDETIQGEFAQNGVMNRISHKRGVISMARVNDYNSASSQFFICHADALYLDGKYAAFGKVIRGMDEVDRIAGLKTDANDYPLTPPVMLRVFFVKPAD